MRPSGLRLFDAHLHVVDPRFPLVANTGYLPDPFPVDAYRAAVAGLDVVGGAVVSGSFQGFDTAYLLDALTRLGPAFVGVAQLPVDVPDDELLALHAAGVRAVRVNLRRGGSAPLADLDRLAHHVHEVVGWHTELYVAGSDLPELEARLRALPQVCIDHLGLTHDGFDVLLRLVGHGAKVKASGFGRVDLDVPAALRALAAVDPGALLAGTDLPSTRAPRPFAGTDLELLVDVLGPDLAARALVTNAVQFYRPPAASPSPASPSPASLSPAPATAPT